MNKQKIAELLTEYKWKDISLENVIEELTPYFLDQKSNIGYGKGEKIMDLEDINLSDNYVLHFNDEEFEVIVTEITRNFNRDYLVVFLMKHPGFIHDVEFYVDKNRLNKIIFIFKKDK